MKVVLDTNVLLSGLMLPKSTPGNIVQAWRNGQAECLITGDKDLLAMRDAYSILTPAEFAKRL